MKKYVCGAVFTEDKSKIALIRKNRPDWQAGKLNLIGGKIEDYDETPYHAMCREFKEETDVFIHFKDWYKFCTLCGIDYDIHIFRAFTDKVLKVQSVTDEAVQLFDTASIPFDQCISNIAWLVPMALEQWNKNPDTPFGYTVLQAEPEKRIEFNYAPLNPDTEEEPEEEDF